MLYPRCPGRLTGSSQFWLVWFAAAAALGFGATTSQAFAPPRPCSPVATSTSHHPRSCLFLIPLDAVDTYVHSTNNDFVETTTTAPIEVLVSGPSFYDSPRQQFRYSPMVALDNADLLVRSSSTAPPPALSALLNPTPIRTTNTAAPLAFASPSTTSSSSSSLVLLSLQDRKIPTPEEIEQKKLTFNLIFWGGGFVAPFAATVFYFGFRFWEK